MTAVHVDTNVIIDVLSGGPLAASSGRAIATAARAGAGVCPIVYAELGGGLSSRSAVDKALSTLGLELLTIPKDALFAAGQAFMAYRRRGGARMSLLSDFVIGAHAAVTGCALLTRDSRRYRTSFPDLRLIIP